jgi:hypothetical protein
VDGRSDAQPGDRMRFGLVSEGLRSFDSGTGRALQGETPGMFAPS